MRLQGDIRRLDFYVLQRWSMFGKGGGKPWPAKRYRHAATCLQYGGSNPQLLISGGYNFEPLNDIWILNLQTESWTEVRSYGYIMHRVLPELNISSLWLLCVCAVEPLCITYILRLHTYMRR